MKSDANETLNRVLDDREYLEILRKIDARRLSVMEAQVCAEIALKGWDNVPSATRIIARQIVEQYRLHGDAPNAAGARP